MYDLSVCFRQPSILLDQNYAQLSIINDTRKHSLKVKIILTNSSFNLNSLVYKHEQTALNCASETSKYLIYC